MNEHCRPFPQVIQKLLFEPELSLLVGMLSSDGVLAVSGMQKKQALHDYVVLICLRKGGLYTLYIFVFVFVFVIVNCPHIAHHLTSRMSGK